MGIIGHVIHSIGHQNKLDWFWELQDLADVSRWVKPEAGKFTALAAFKALSEFAESIRVKGAIPKDPITKTETVEVSGNRLSVSEIAGWAADPLVEHEGQIIPIQKAIQEIEG